MNKGYNTQTTIEANSTAPGPVLSLLLREFREELEALHCITIDLRTASLSLHDYRTPEKGMIPETAQAQSPQTFVECLNAEICTLRHYVSSLREIRNGLQNTVSA